MTVSLGSARAAFTLSLEEDNNAFGVAQRSRQRMRMAAAVTNIRGSNLCTCAT
jgi:hypothetical protein